MTRILLPLIADVETHGSPVPSSPPTLYDKIDEDPNDGDATRVRLFNAGETEASAFDAGVIPANANIQAVTVRWAALAASGIDPTLMRAGLRLGGIDHWAEDRAPASDDYSVFEEVFATDPRTGDPWEKEGLVGQSAIAQATEMPGVPGFPRLSQRVVLVDYVPGPSRVSAKPQSLSPQPLTVTLLATARVGVMRSLAPRSGALRSRGPSGALRSRAPSGAPESKSPSGKVE